ncbi:MAG: RsmF rRNA methyltransferase first C-terminal domain-containing protein [Clostridia bacterium]|nr:RsmF rRNA methyltransferase first C-terminal domain-containing protein [Clostridia bacterium]
MDFPIEFAHRMALLLGDEYDAFTAAYDAPLRRGLRVNTQKIATDEFWRLFPLPLEPSPFAADSFYLDAPHKAGSDPLHHAGAYYMQEPSAASAVAVLAPQAGEWILDLCAAPGGKSTQIATALGDSGLLWSNEYVGSRARILAQNLERWGARQAVVSNADSNLLCEELAEAFDGVLVDAPCSGEGMFRKEPQALTEWSMDNIRLCAKRQAEILHNASLAVRPGGRLVYSTCTFAPEENEGAVAAFLECHEDFYLEPIRVNWGCAGFSAAQVAPFCPVSPTMDTTGCRRILPQHGGEGHFIALLRRKGDAPRRCLPPYPLSSKDIHRQEAAALYSECFTDVPQGSFATVGEQVRLLPPDMPACRGIHMLAAGIPVATLCKNRLEPCHGAFLAALPNACQQLLDFSPDEKGLLDFLRGQEIPCGAKKSWTAVAVGSLPVGFGKAVNGRLKNRYPKGLRLL